MEAFNKNYGHVKIKITIAELTIAPHSEACARSIEQLTEKAKGNVN